MKGYAVIPQNCYKVSAKELFSDSKVQCLLNVG